MISNIKLHFSGPYTFFKGAKSLFHSAYAKSEGIYLWVIKQTNDNLNYIHYIGETTAFSKRHKEHITHVLGLNYQILDADKARQGIPEPIWNGMWRDKTENTVGYTLDNYDSVSKKVIEYIRVIDIYFASTHLTTDMRKHIEGCIGWNLRNRHPDLKIFYPDDNHVGTKPERLRENIIITSDEKILGLDDEIMI
jgi:hypothetical protein